MIHMHVHQALARLNAGLDQLAAAAERQAGLEVERQALADERNVMAEDRARLAAELDESLARNHNLEQASLVVDGRLAGLGAALRAMAQGEETV